MAALTNAAAFKTGLPSCSRRPGTCQRRTLICKAQAEEQGWQKSVGVRLLAAGLAATALVASPSIADAKVVIEQPKTKKVFQGKSKQSQAQPSQSGQGGGPSLPSFSLPSVSLPSVSLPSVGLPSVNLPSVGLPSVPGPDLSGLSASPSGGLDVRSVALPGAILGIGAAGFAAFRLDSGFREMMREGLVKDSTGYVGYEEAVDQYASGAARAVGKGTKKIAKAGSKAKSKAKDAGKSSGLGGFFGKKK